MSKIIKYTLASLCLAATSTVVQATPVLSGSETSLQTVLNSLHVAGGSPDVNADQLPNDELWRFEGSGTAAATFIIEIAGNAASNVFGMYDAASLNLVPLFVGSASNADRATVSLFANGSLKVMYTDYGGSGDFIQNYAAGTFAANLFGFYLGTGSGNLYSQHSLNANGADQLVAFRGDGDVIQLPGAMSGVWGPSSYILAWEDVAYGASDKDFNDLVVYIESVTPVSVAEPASLALLGMGLVGVGLTRRRTRKAKI